MAGGKRLVYTVFVQDPNGDVKSFGPADVDVPDWALEQITNPTAWGEDSAEADDAAQDDGDGPVAYSSLNKGPLQDLVDERNADRDPEGDGYIVVGGTGTKADLIAALEADDEAPDDDGDDE